MENLRQTFTPDYGDEAETALLSAVQIARKNWDTATPEEKLHLREIYRAALKALSTYMCVGS